MNQYAFGYSPNPNPHLQCDDLDPILNFIFGPGPWLVSLTSEEIKLKLEENNIVKFEFHDENRQRVIPVWIKKQ